MTLTERPLVQEAVEESRDSKAHFWLWFFIGLVTLGVLSLGALAVASVTDNETQQDEIAALRDSATINADSVKRLQDQVRDLGGVPVVDSPEPVPGPRGEPGATGPKGDQGEKGDPGATGPGGPSGPMGPPGAAGAPGEPGTNGQDGAEGPVGPEGPQGPVGPEGPQGPQGPAGDQGPSGPTCPEGASRQTRTYDPNPLIAGDEETWYVCVASP